MNDDEKHARRISQIMKDANTGAGEIMMRRSIDAKFMRPDGADQRQILAGYNFAAAQGWIELSNVAITLTPKGAQI